MKAPSRTRILLFLAVACAAIGGAHLADPAALPRLQIDRAANTEWGRLFRVMGYLPGWLLLAVGLVLVDLRRSLKPPLSQFWARGALLAGAATLSGMLAMAVKLTVRRKRPFADDSLFYAFRPFADDTWTTSRLGMPSSHAAVAFGAAFMLCRFHPAGSPVWLLFALGCAATRLFAQAHFLSDVVVAAALSYAVAWALWHLHVTVHHRDLYLQRKRRAQ